jgi:peptidoglycan-N-acetylglucosamine deacetylase
MVIFIFLEHRQIKMIVGILQQECGIPPSHKKYTIKKHTQTPELREPLPFVVTISHSKWFYIVLILRRLLLILLFFIYAAAPFARIEHPKRLAITIDDAPSPASPLFTGQQRALTIIQQLKKAKAPPVGVFAIGSHVASFGVDQLRAFGLAGHAIGNHTYAHRCLKNCSSEWYIQDIAKAENLLKNLPGYVPLFRYPGLDEGYPAQSKKVQAALSSMGYINANVTINNFDFYISYILQKALREGKFIDFDKLRKVYLHVMLECVEFFDGLSILQGKNNINHVLLMHSNDLTALYIGDLLQALRDRGWTIISIHNAYKPIPANFKNKPIKIMAETSRNPASIRNTPQSMSPQYLSTLLQKEKVFIDVTPLHTYTASK